MIKREELTNPKSCISGINWELLHELLEAELERLNKGTSTYESNVQWYRDEFNRMNNLAVDNAEKQS